MNDRLAALPFRWIAALCASLACLFAPVAAAAPDVAPDALVRKSIDEVLAVIKTDKDLQAGNQRKILDLVEEKVLPHFDFNRMTRLAVGRNWAQASDAQKESLVREFRTLLVRTYSGALASFRNNTIDYRPLRMQPGENDVTVKTVVNQANGQGIPIDYSLEKSADGSWKAYDVIVAGVSLVTNYREEFNTVIRDQGVDALIKQLQGKSK